jgi:hypothetical protein
MKRSLDRRYCTRRASPGQDRLHPGAAGLDDIVATPTKKQIMGWPWRSAPGALHKGFQRQCKRSSDEVLRDPQHDAPDDDDGRRRGVPLPSASTRSRRTPRT